MFKRNLASVSAVAVSLSLFAAPVAAQEFSEWDTNTDAGIDQEEYQTGLEDAGVFGDWDADDSDWLSEDEFNEGIGDNEQAFTDRFGEDSYADWDANDDDQLSDDEFYEGTYSAYDADDSGAIEEPEYGDLGDDMGDGGFWDV